MSFKLSELAQATAGRLVDGGGDLVLDRLVTDSREAGPGALFVALVGETTDGHRFLADAVAAGVSAVLCREAPESLAVPRVVVPDTKEALVDFTRHMLQSHRLRVVGITGSVGKTTTKEMIAAVGARRYGVLKTEGNLNTYTGLPVSVARLEPRHHLFVAEYAMSATGEIALLARMAPPDIAVVLNVGLAHVGPLGSIEAVATAKRELVEALTEEGTAILNADDPRVAAMASHSRGQVLFYGLGQIGDGAPAAAEVRAESLQLLGLDGSQFTLALPGGTARVKLQLPGIHSVSNALAAAAVGHRLGVGPDEIAHALESCRPMGGRLVIRPGRHGATVIDDAYNASPASVEAALAVLLAAGPDRPRVAVLGEMLELGDWAEDAHRGIGRAAAGADFLVAAGEHAETIAAGAAEAGMPAERIATAADAGEAAELATELLESRMKGAVVLVKASRGIALEKVVERLVAGR